MSLRHQDPMTDTPTGQLLNMVRTLEKAVTKNSTYNTNCMNCSDGSCKDCGYKSDRGDRPMPKLPSPKGNKNMKGKKVEKADATTQFLEDRGIFVKYQSEPKESRPQFMEVSGSTTIRAQGYGTNQVLPYTEDGTAKKGISEVYKMPSVSQTGYDAKSSSLHMHLTDGGGSTTNLDSFEDKLAELKKSTVGKEGIIEEIAGLIEKVYARL
tara:strand:- start:17745 stop:18374 length:630 start_codon:yes stop_codon:yes gene_type:complete